MTFYFCQEQDDSMENFLPEYAEEARQIILQYNGSYDTSDPFEISKEIIIRGILNSRDTNPNNLHCHPKALDSQFRRLFGLPHQYLLRDPTMVQ